MMDLMARLVTPLSWWTCGGQCADSVSRGVGTSVEERIEGGHEPAHMGRGVGLVLEKLYGFESCVVIDEYEQVLIPGMLCAHECPRYVGVYEPTSMGRFVVHRIMRVTRGVSFRAGVASAKLAVSERGGGVRSESRQALQASGARMQAGVHAGGGIGG
eukprot:6205785-Pleurochrysis_carterae.AAC.1